jgi:hypothetical protein
MEPQFLDDETLTDNLDDEKASRVINWLINIYKTVPEDLDLCIEVAREINSLKVLDSEFFANLMTKMENIYAQRI